MMRYILSLLALLWAVVAHADPYTVAGVAVDSKGPTAIQAQTDAILDGQTRAANLLLKRLTLETDRMGANYVPPTSDEATRLIRAMSVANEKRSTDRYIGDITVAFVPSRVRDYARSKGLTLLDTVARERIVVPMRGGVLSAPDSPLAIALGGPLMQHGLTPARLGRQDALLASGASAAELIGGNMDALAAAAAALGGQQLLLVDVNGVDGAYTASVTDVRVDAGEFQRIGSFSARTLEGLASRISDRLQSDWKTANASVVTTDPASLSAMQVTVLYGSLGEWQRLQQAIAGAARVRDTRLDALSKTGALMTLSYVGDVDALGRELSGKGARLVSHPQLGTVITPPGFTLP